MPVVGRITTEAGSRPKFVWLLFNITKLESWLDVNEIFQWKHQNYRLMAHFDSAALLDLFLFLSSLCYSFCAHLRYQDTW